MSYTPVLGHRYHAVSEIVTDVEKNQCDGCLFSVSNGYSSMCDDALEPLFLQETIPFFSEKKSGSVRCERRVQRT